MVTIGTLNGGNITITTGPAGHPETRFTLQGGTVETYNIIGALSWNFMNDNHFIGQDEETGDDVWLKRLISVDVGNTVSTIGSETFYMCGTLTSITIPNSVTSIAEGVFNDCESLTSVTFAGNDRSTVQGMTYYPFGLNNANFDGVTIHCTDGDIQVQYG